MIFGNPERLAIEFELDEDYSGEWLYGYFRYWLKGRNLSDGTCTSLRDILFELEGMRWAQGKRQSDRFNSMVPTEVIRMISGVLYGVPGEVGESEEERALWERTSEEEGWLRHRILPIDTSTSGWSVYCIQAEELARIVWGMVPFNDAEELFLDVREVDDVLQLATAALGEIYNEEIENLQKD